MALSEAKRFGVADLKEVLATHVVAERIYAMVRRVLDAEGVEHLVLKGPHLAAVAYEQPWQRGFNDLDILVKQDQFDQALEALTAAGFSLRPPPPGRAATIAAAYDRNLLAPDGSVVEIHRGLSPHELYPVDYDGLFARARSFSFGRTPARGLSPEDLLLHLVIHAAKSQFWLIEQKHLQDIEVLVSSHELDWPAFMERADRAGCRRAAWVMLDASNRLCGAAIPLMVLDELRPARLVRWWLNRWLARDRFPMIRHPRLPKWLRKALLVPVLVDRLPTAIRASSVHGLIRVRDLVGRSG